MLQPDPKKGLGEGLLVPNPPVKPVPLTDVKVNAGFGQIGRTLFIHAAALCPLIWWLEKIKATAIKSAGIVFFISVCSKKELSIMRDVIFI
jgi:hypothetical protein